MNVVIHGKYYFQNSKSEDSESDIWQTLRLLRSKYTMICKLLKLETVETESKEISWWPFKDNFTSINMAEVPGSAQDSGVETEGDQVDDINYQLQTLLL